MSLPERWFEPRLSAGLLPLVPLAGLFGALSGVRRELFRRGWCEVRRMRVPVVVVGNLIVGGAGKTPLTLWLVNELARRGRRPGIVSRGYGGRATRPLSVSLDADPALVGDEPLLLARRSRVPVWVGRDRAAAASALLQAHPEVDMLVCDDGLQHYGLARDFEIAVFDARGAGNGWLLPAGPLREPLGRLRQFDAVIFNGIRHQEVAPWAAATPSFDMALLPGRFRKLGSAGEETCAAADLKGQRLFALAGIGHPPRFFQTLSELGLDFERRPFPDHHRFTAADFSVPHGGILLLTEKDAVKCPPTLATEAWVLPVEAEISLELVELILEKIRGR